MVPVLSITLSALLSVEATLAKPRHGKRQRMCWPAGPIAASLRASIPTREPGMPKIQRIIVPDIPKPVSHYCHVTRAGPHVWVAGVVGQAPDGSIPSDVVAQFDAAIATMDKCLKAAGAGAEHVVKVQVFM